MKIYITGHTSGIGKSLYDLLTSNGHHVIGLSRTNGFDLTKNLDDFVKNDFDVYINNAYVEYKQTDLLYKLFDANKDRKCHIVNIGSCSSDNGACRNYVNPYSVHKTALQTACSQLQYCDPECKITLIKTGRVDTPMVTHRNTYKMDPYYIAETINWVISQPGRAFIKSITVDSLHNRVPISEGQQ